MICLNVSLNLLKEFDIKMLKLTIVREKLRPLQKVELLDLVFRSGIVF